MYHLLTGKNPSEPPYEIYPIRYWNQEFSQGLEQIILKCTQLDPEKRYQKCSSIIYDLEHYYELDQNYRKKEKVKLGTFVAAMSMALITGVAAITCHVYANNLQQSGYETHIDNADKNQNSADMETNYIEAINIDPSKADAYINLVDKVYLADENFSEDEATELRQLLITTSGNRTYEDILSQNGSEYALFAYRLGLAYFYSYEGTGNKQQSAYWFKKAAEGDLEQSQKERAVRLGSIADYYISLGTIDKSGDGGVSYSDYWDDLMALSDGNIAELDNATTALVIYKELASQISSNAEKFHRDGVAYDDMELALQNIEEHVKNDIDSTDAVNIERVTTMEEELRTNIEKARQTISLSEQEN